MADKKEILAGRKAVDAYRRDHADLERYAGGWYKGMSDDHTPLLDIMKAGLRKQGFESIQEFFNANREYCARVVDPAKVWVNREDLSLLTTIDREGIKIDVGGNHASLYIDGISEMDTRKIDHASMFESVQECPNNARALVGGLGLGLILLYLASFERTKEVVVVEVNKRLVNILTEPFATWFASEYPEFKFTIITGDVGEEVVKLGKFDWIFLDTNSPWKSHFIPYLNNGGNIIDLNPYPLEWK